MWVIDPEVTGLPSMMVRFLDDLRRCKERW
jgi:hypothetical protein